MREPNPPSSLPGEGELDAIAIEHEELTMRRGRRTGAYSVLAIHSGAGRPVIGPARVLSHLRPQDAIASALRISRLTSLQCALAGIDGGGGGAVVDVPAAYPDSEWERTALLHDFGELIESLDGRYTAYRDAGLSIEDLVTLAGPTPHLTGLPRRHAGPGDTTALAALGVEATMRAAIRHGIGPIGIAQVRAVVLGLGALGTMLCRRLLAAGAEVLVTDVDPAREDLAAELGVVWLDPAAAPFERCEVLVPCAPGIGIGATEVDRLECRVVCGAADDALADERACDRLEEAGIVLAPPEVAAAGAAIAAWAELTRRPRGEAVELTIAAEERMDRVLHDAAAGGISPRDAAVALAVSRLDDRRRVGRPASV